jgi:hypothetical protein
MTALKKTSNVCSPPSTPWTRAIEPGPQLLATKFGGLDVFGMIADNHTHLDLLPSSILFDIEPSFNVPMLSAAALLAEKRPMIRNDDPQ